MSEPLAVLPAALTSTLTIILVLILPTRRTATLLATTTAAALPATLTALTTLLTTLLLTITLPGIARVRASHNSSNAKVHIDSGELLPECRPGATWVASTVGMKKGLTHVRIRNVFVE